MNHTLKLGTHKELASAPAGKPVGEVSASKQAEQLSLRVGELVEVRSVEEILLTLDDRGQLDNLPFMPEMLKYCGRQMRVSKRAHKTCDPALGIRARRMEDTVHLENIRCDGCFHDNCQADCLIFWKEAWLKRVGTDTNAKVPLAQKSACTVKTLHERVKTTTSSSESATYTCQNTEVKHATQPLKWWDARQYVEDYTSGNVTLRQLVAGLGYTAWRTASEAGIGLGKPLRLVYDLFQRLAGGSPYPLKPYGVPKGQKSPRETLDLKEGELVRVKSHEEILKTLDSAYRNRGLYFDPDYVPFTQNTYRVKRRVQQIIDERTSKMVHFKTDAIVLEGVYCEGKYAYCRRFCPRAIVPYWREIWLERVSEDSKPPIGAPNSHQKLPSSAGNRHD